MPRTGGTLGHSLKRHSDKKTTTFPLSRGSAWTHSGPLPSVRDLCRRGSAHRPRFTTPRGNGARSPDPQPPYRCAGAVRLADRTEPRAPRSCSPADTFSEAWIVSTIQIWCWPLSIWCYQRGARCRRPGRAQLPIAWSHSCRSRASAASWSASMVPADLSAPKTALRHPQEQSAWVRPPLISTIVVRCSIGVAARVPLALSVPLRFCAGSAALGRRAWGRMGPGERPSVGYRGAMA